MVLKLNTDRMGHLEVEDDGPYETQRQLWVSVSNIIIPDVHQLDLRFAQRTHLVTLSEEEIVVQNTWKHWKKY